MLITVPMKAYGEATGSVAHEAHAAGALGSSQSQASGGDHQTNPWTKVSHVSTGCRVAFIGEPGSRAAALAVVGEDVPARNQATSGIRVLWVLNAVAVLSGLVWGVGDFGGRQGGPACSSAAGGVAIEAGEHAFARDLSGGDIRADL